MALKIWSYNPGSKGARALAETLGCRVLARAENSLWTGRGYNILINWGNSSRNDLEARNLAQTPLVLNIPENVNEVSNKLKFFSEYYQLLPLPAWSADRSTAMRWLQRGASVVARHELRGHSGAGIEFLEGGGHSNYPDESHVAEAPLYTRYMKRRTEYRVHCIRQANGTMHFKWQQKRRSYACDTPDWKVRNHENGFIYSVNDVRRPDGANELERKLNENVPLSFYAADVMAPTNDSTRLERSEGLKVLEINTAPGLESETVLAFYKERLSTWL